MTRKNRTQLGQSLIEYVALTALVAIVSIGTVKTFGGKVRSRLNQITTSFDRNVQQGLRGGSRGSAHDEEDDAPEGHLRLPKELKLPRSIRLPHGLGL